MAIDKAVDSAQLNGAMTATANAIRAAGGTTGSIAWNQTTGFADAVSNLGGGFYPSLLITAPTGHTITATNGVDTVTLTEISEGQYWGEVTDYGEWIGTDTTAGSVVIVQDVTRVKQYEQKPLNDYTWDEISAFSQAGMAASLFSVGDMKAVELSGTCGTLSLNTTLYAYIIGFDHNKGKEGSGITFGTWKTADGVDVCLVDSRYNADAGNSGGKYFQMNHWGESYSSRNTNFGGWKGCDARYDILGSTKTAPSGYGSTPTTSRVGYDAPADTATSPVANTLMSCLPSDLRAAMKPITKYTDNYGNNSNVADHVTASVDYLPLLSEWEIFGARTCANEYEKNSQAQYAYYASGNSKVKYQHSSTGLTAIWVERSPYYNSSYMFCAVNTNGDASFSNSRYSDGLAPAFKV